MGIWYYEHRHLHACGRYATPELTFYETLLKWSFLVFSAMRALALTRSRVFSAFILLLSLGPVAVNIVRVLRPHLEFTPTHDAIYTW